MKHRVCDNMKTVAKKMKKLFNSKRNLSQSEYANIDNRSDTTSLGSQCSVRSASRRKLPAIPPSPACRQRMFTPPTYRFALNWLNRNKETLDLAIDLINMHPKLLQLEACTKLKQFVQRSSNNGKELHTSQQGQHLLDTTDQDYINESQDTFPLPKILVSHAPDEILARNPGVSKDSVSQNVRLCGDVAADKWQRLVTNLCCKYSVSGVTPDTSHTQRLGDVDTFLFLLDSKSFVSENCRQALQEAYTENKTVVFVRDMEFELFDYTIPKTSLQHNRTINGESSAYLTSELDSDNDVTSVTPADCVIAAKKCLIGTSELLYSDNNLLSSSTFSSMDSGLGQRSRKTSTESRSSRVLHVDRLQSAGHTTEHRNRTPISGSFDISKLIIAEYGMALTYHHIYHKTCVNRITAAIDNKLVVQKKPGTSRLLPTLSSIALRNTEPSSVCDNYSSSVDPDEFGSSSSCGSSPSRKADSKRRRSVTFADDTSLPGSHNRRGSSASDTVFVITNPRCPENPMIVHWPPSSSVDSIASTPSMDSLGFQDVDLSKCVNEFDLFTESE